MALRDRRGVRPEEVEVEEELTMGTDNLVHIFL